MALVRVLLLGSLFFWLPGWFVGAALAEQPLEATALYQKGMGLYQTQRYPEALVAFESAYEKTRLPRLLFNIGQTHLKLGHGPQALLYFERFEKEEPGSLTREERRLLRESRSKAASLIPAPAQAQPAAPLPDAAVKAEAPPRPQKSSRTWVWALIGVAAAGVVATAVAVPLALQAQGPEVIEVPWMKLP